ncbi:hypothetical protein GQ53DRAFT_766581 [Thozetella sp. PMI_491]|nr:hypothetical protein GQ53DRAFT_766581 [Thozetella sp. PMI_491]
MAARLEVTEQRSVDKAKHDDMVSTSTRETQGSTLVTSIPTAETNDGTECLPLREAVFETSLRLSYSCVRRSPSWKAAGPPEGEHKFGVEDGTKRLQKRDAVARGPTGSRSTTKSDLVDAQEPPAKSRLPLRWPSGVRNKIVRRADCRPASLLVPKSSSSSTKPSETETTADVHHGWKSKFEKSRLSKRCKAA